MRNCALRKLHTPAAIVAGAFSFTSALQAAAGRAWARRVIAHTPTITGYRQLSGASSRNNDVQYPSASQKQRVTRGTSRPLQCSNSRLESTIHQPGNRFQSTSEKKERKRSPSQPAVRQKQAPRGVTFIDPALVDDDEFLRVDPSIFPASQVDPHTDETGSNFTIPSSVVTSVSQHLPIRSPTGTLPPVSSRRSLWHNMLYLFNLEKANLPSLIDYHDHHPMFQSTRSYNILTSLAIRHQSFGAAGWLLTSMHNNGIHPNLETWKLRFRWLVRSGWSKRAWEEFMTALKGGHLPVDPNSDSMLHLFAEFCSPRSRATKANHSRDRYARVTIPRHRLRELCEQFSRVLKNDIGTIHPRNVYFIILLLLRSGQSEHAMSFAVAYFQKLPQVLSAHTIDRCLRIIHLQIAFGSRLRGLARFHWARKTMKVLLRCHPALCPTSTSLYLLLSPLKHTKHCGTVAAKVVHEFKRKWGSHMEDSRVRRRLASLAVKEGRLDIVKDVIGAESISRRSRRSYDHQAEILGGIKRSPYKRLLRFPYRKVYGRTGHEQSLWLKLERRARRSRRLKFKKGSK